MLRMGTAAAAAELALPSVVAARESSWKLSILEIGIMTKSPGRREFVSAVDVDVLTTTRFVWGSAV